MMGVTPTIVLQKAIDFDKDQTVKENQQREQQQQKFIEEETEVIGNNEQLLDPFATLSTFASTSATTTNLPTIPTTQSTIQTIAPSPSQLASEERFQEALDLAEGKKRTSPRTKNATLNELKNTILDCCGSDIAIKFELCFSPYIQEASNSEHTPSIDTLRKAVLYKQRAELFCDLVVGLNKSNGIHRPLINTWCSILSRAEKEFARCLELLNELKQAQEDGSIVSYKKIMDITKFERYLNGLGEMWEVVQSLQTDLVSVKENLLKKRDCVVRMWGAVGSTLEEMGRPNQYSTFSKDSELQALKSWSKKQMNLDVPLHFCKISLCPSCSAHCVRCQNFYNSVKKSEK
jgi:hypothetical protein